MRALQEKAGLARQMADQPHAGAGANTGGEPPDDYAAMAARAQQVADQLKGLLTGDSNIS